MRKTAWLSLLFAAVAVFQAGAAQQLRLFIWSEYIDPAVVKQFEHRFGCKVTIDLYEDAESMMAKVQGGGVSLYDVVVPPDHLVKPMVALNLLAPLRHSNLPNLKNLDPKFASPPYDRGNKFTVAYQWGTVGVFHRVEPGAKVEESWAMFFDASKQMRPFSLIDSQRDLIGAALKFKGHSLNSTDPARLREARDLILEAKKRSASFDGSVAAKNKIVAKTLKSGIVYSGEAARGMADDKATRYFIPKEGSQIWQDNLAVLAKAPNRDLAEKFIDFILGAKVGAEVSKFTQCATPNAAAKMLLGADDLSNPAIYPPAAVMEKLEFLEDLGAKSRLYDEVWTQIKTR